MILIEALIYLSYGSEGPGMAEVLFNPQRIIEMLIYPRHGSEGLGMTKVLFNL